MRSRFGPLAPTKAVRISLVALSLFVVLGCSPLPEPMLGSDAGADAGAGANDPTDGGSAGADGGSGGGTSDAGIALPIVTSASVVTHGSIRVLWTNPTPACDAMALMRSKDGAAAVVASQPPSTATEVVDAPGHASGTFCYSLSCSRGGAAQGSSNQKCATQ
jgi:hypothetical protein